MPIKLRLSLRQKIVIYFLIVLSPVVMLAYSLVNENSKYVKHHGLDSISTRAALVQLSLDELIDSSVRFLENMARTPAVKNRDLSASIELFATVLPLYPNFTTIGSIGEQGQIFASAQRGGTFSFTIADRPHFQEAMRTGKPVVSGRVIGRVSDEPVFVVVVPVRDDSGRLSGAVGAGISLQQIQQRLERLDAEAGDTIIVDSDGLVLSHPDWNYVSVETNLRSLPPIESALSGKRGTSEYVDPVDNSDWFWAYRPMERAPWAVAVRYPVTSVYSPMYSTLLKWVLYLLGALAIALILASLSAERITRPLRRLVNWTPVLAPTGSTGGPQGGDLDELHQLINGFNRICSTLSQTSAELAGVKGQMADQARKLEVLTQQAVEAREDERRRIARDIHDGVLQLIAVAQGGTRIARAAANSRPDLAAGRLGDVEQVLEQVLTELRGMARGIYPPAVEEVGLVQAVFYHLAIFKEAFGIRHFSLRVSGEPQLVRPEAEMAAFRIAQEALSNVGKHAQSAMVEVYVDFTPPYLRLVVADHGRGFDVRNVSSADGDHLGLANMRERAEEVGGTCMILSMPGEGTRVEVEVPVSFPSVDIVSMATNATERIHG